MDPHRKLPRVDIACGGTGGHLFPGLAVAEALKDRDCDVSLFVSPKQLDQTAVQGVCGMDVVTLPAVAFSFGKFKSFVSGFAGSFRAARQRFNMFPPQAVLGMGAFTSVPPMLAARKYRVVSFLHEANAVPGRANRWLAPWVDRVFVYFQEAAPRLRNSSVLTVGMPVRSPFQPMDAGACRTLFGLSPDKPVLLITGGSQGAEPVNDLILRSLPALAGLAPELQYLHLTGAREEAKVRAAYAARNRKAVVRAFLTEMELALNAATVAVSRAGASSLAELAAVRVPAILIPYPHAADDHQHFNALAFAETGAARMVAQSVATPETLARMIADLAAHKALQASMRLALVRWYWPKSAEQMADKIREAIDERFPQFCVPDSEKERAKSPPRTDRLPD
jgi:UDP-N-acetylglucosamine--N-acetylmuramyl-(pentapeptide) pyrophosphoryl-undecaprenol N-acetylglucosamine transferase